MRQMGLVKYADIIESAMLRNNYFVANLALDYMIAAIKKEIDSDDFEKCNGASMKIISQNMAFSTR